MDSTILGNVITACITYLACILTWETSNSQLQYQKKSKVLDEIIKKRVDSYNV